MRTFYLLKFIWESSVSFSFLEFPIPNDVAFIAEIGLGGELRTVSKLFHVVWLIS